MAGRKKKAAPKKVRTVENAEYTELEIYAIWLNEYYKALRSAGFAADLALSLIMDKQSYPAWVKFQIPNDVDVSKYVDEEDED